jgi:hypothetical protein
MLCPHLELQFEHKIYEEPLLAVLEDAHLLQGVQVHVDGDLSLMIQPIRSSVTGISTMVGELLTFPFLSRLFVLNEDRGKRRSKKF